MRNGEPTQEIKDESYTGQTIELDNKRFVDCRFDNCTFVFQGSSPFQFKENVISQCKWRFSGYAGLTIGMLAQMYQGGFDEHVEELFQKIRERAEG